MGERCIFCEMVAGTFPASVVCQDELTLAVVDIRQFNPGHVLVMPKQHFADVRDLDAATGAVLMATVSQVTRAVGLAFPNEGLTLWHSIGPAAFQEVPHLHIHIHPRRLDDGFQRLYPSAPPRADRATMDDYAARVREHLLADEPGPATTGCRSDQGDRRRGIHRDGVESNRLSDAEGKDPTP